MNSSQTIILWMLVGYAVGIAFAIDNYQSKRFFDFGSLEDKVEEKTTSRFRTFIAIVLVVIAGALLLTLMAAFWPLNAYAMYRIKKMGM